MDTYYQCTDRLDGLGDCEGYLLVGDPVTSLKPCLCLSLPPPAPHLAGWLNQMILALVIFLLLAPLTSDARGFQASTMSPISRFPLFLMGVYAGLLCLRHPTKHLPWPTTILGLLPKWGQSGMGEKGQEGDEEEEARWATMADQQSLLVVTMILVVAGADTYLRITSGRSLSGPLWLQVINPFAHLNILVALTRDVRRASLTHRLVRHPLAMWLGNLSVALYLTHFLVKDYYVRTHRKTWPTPDFFLVQAFGPITKEYTWETRGTKPGYLSMVEVPVVLALSLLVSHVIYQVFEVPSRRWIRHASRLWPLWQIGQWCEDRLT